MGLTRARKRAGVLFAANRRIYNQWQSSLPSRFIDELPEDHVLRRAAAGLHGGLSEHAMPWRSRRQVRTPAPEVVTQEAAAAGSFPIGTRIFHQKFGYGRVTSVDGNKLEVAFEKAGVKKVIDSFVQPA